MKKFLISYLIIISTAVLTGQNWVELNRKILEYYNKNDFNKALEYAEQAKKQAVVEFGKEHHFYATSLDNLGNIYLSMGNYQAALPLIKEALNIRLKVVGKEHPDYATSLNNLAGVYIAMEDYKAALLLYNEALAIYNKIYGKEHPSYSRLLNNLAELYRSLGDYESAIPLLKEALAIRLKLFGKNHPDYANSLNSLAGLYESIEDYKSALPLFKEALYIRQKVFGRNHPDYASSLNNLAELYHSMGDYELALPMLKEALVIIRNTLGKENALYSTVINNLASLYQDLADYSASLPLYKEALAIRLKVLGRENSAYAGSLNNIAGIYLAMGDYKAALPLYNEALAINMKVFGSEHPVYATSLNSLAVLYESMGDYKVALALCKEALSIRLKILGKENTDYITSLNNLAGIYLTMGDYKAALPLYNEVLATRLKVLGKEHPDYAESLNNLASLFKSIGDYESALPLFKEALAIRLKVLGKEHPDYATSLNNLAEIYHSLGDYELALPYYEESYAIMLKTLGKEHLDYITILNNLADLYQSMGDYGAALPLFKDLANNMKFLGRTNPIYLAILNNLASLFVSMGDYDSALPLFKEALAIRLKVLGKDHPDYALSLNNLAVLFESMGDYESALPLFKETLAIRLKVLGKEHPDYALSLKNLAVSYFDNNNLDSCKYNLIQSGEIIKSHLTILDILSDKQKMIYFERNKVFFNGFNTLGTRIFNYDKSIAADLLNTHLYSQNLLFFFAKRMKETILRSNDKELTGLFNEYINLRSFMARAYSLTGEVTKNYKLNVDSLKKAADTYEQELSNRARVYKDYLNKRNYDWTHIRDNLRRNQAAVTILRFRNYNKRLTDTIIYAALIVTRETVDNPKLIVLKRSAEFEGELLAKYYSTLLPGQRDSENSNNNSNCYEAFWDEIEKEIEGKDVIYFCPNGVYNLINLNTLKYPDGDYIYEKKDIVIVNSLMELLEEDKQEYSSRRALLVGDPDYSLNIESHKQLGANIKGNITGGGSYALTRDFKNTVLSELPYSKIEVTNISELLRDHKWYVKCLTGKEALEEAVKSEMNPRILHIATHGYFANNIRFNSRKQMETSLLFGQNPVKVIDNPMLRSGLMFGGSQNTLDGKYDPMSQMDDGILTGYEAMDLQLENTELVILSACETGLGEIRDGESVYGLQRSFKLAGAKNLIMSLWKVDDKATQLLMRKFYEFWLEGKPKREAFKMAQDYLRKETVFKDPFYWGGFVYIGMERQGNSNKLLWVNNIVEKIREDSRYYLWVLLLILPLILIIYLRRKLKFNKQFHK